jgi:hypothetical protein
MVVLSLKASDDRPLLFICYGGGVGRRSLTRLLTPDAARQDRGRRQADLLAPAHERLHFFQGNGAIVVGMIWSDIE